MKLLNLLKIDPKLKILTISNGYANFLLTSNKYLFFLLALFVLTAMVDNGHASTKLSLSLGLNESYNDNILLANKKKEQDTLHVAEFSISLETSNHFLLTSLDYYLASKFFSENSQLDNTTQLIDLQMLVKPSPTIAINLAEHFRTSEEFDFTVTGLESRPLSSVIRQDRTVNDFDWSIAKRLTGRSSVKCYYNNIYEDVDTIREVDEKIYSIGIGLEYLFGRMNRHQFRLDLGKKEYSFQENALPYTERDFSTSSLVGGPVFDLPWMAQLNPYAGIVKATDDNKDALSKEEHFIIGGISYRTGSNLLSADYSYEHTVSGRGGFGELVVKDIASVKLSGNLTPFITMQLSSSGARNSYSNANISGYRKDNTIFRLMAELQYQIMENWAAGASYSFFEADYQVPAEAGIFDFEQSTVMLTTTYNFSKIFFLQFKYDYTWRTTTDNVDDRNDNSFERNLVSINFGIKEINWDNSNVLN